MQQTYIRYCTILYFSYFLIDNKLWAQQPIVTKVYI